MSSLLIIGPEPPGIDSYKARKTPIGWVYDIEDLVELPTPENIDDRVDIDVKEYRIWWTEMNMIIQKTLKRRSVLKQKHLYVDKNNTTREADKCWSCGRIDAMKAGMCYACSWKSS
jgi:hypothetical protein